MTSIDHQGTTRRSADVIVVGAGAAGLAAARALHEQHIDVIVLEARDRIGGRMHTIHDPNCPEPIELGAAFVHGRAQELVTLVRKAGLRIIDIAGRHWLSQGDRFRRAHDYWGRLTPVMKRLDPDRTPDRSFAEFLARHPGGRSLARERTLARRFVEGYHAADPERVSERALAEGGSPGDDMAERRIGRVLEGYDAVVRWLAEPLGARVRLASAVARVRWQRRAVEVETSDAGGAHRETLQTRALIITVPLGVLKAQADEPGTIAFEPALNVHQQALARLEMGHVVRVVLRLSDRFWADDAYVQRVGADELHTLSFLHTADEDFATWWTAYPTTSPILVAWHGGPGAAALLARGRSEVEATALKSLSRQFHLSRARLTRLVEDLWFHDWTHDPFARGAYSYQAVDGSRAPAVLARSIESTLFFAGEATSTDGASGTVHGALATGQRAAERAARALNA